MQEAISKLLSIATPAVGPEVSTETAIQSVAGWTRLGYELAEIINLRNGFYVFESALLLRPLQSAGPPLGILEWNAADLWKGEYDDNGFDDVLFFAEDIFGTQFCLRDDTIWTFEPETAEFEEICSSLPAWVEYILNDSDVRTGYPLASQWRARHSALPQGMRLLPKVPFFCGGKYEIENLYAIDDVQGMRFRASIERQVRHLPDGQRVVFRTERPPEA